MQLGAVPRPGGDAPFLDACARTLGHGDTRFTGMDKHRTLLALLRASRRHFFQINHELLGVVFRVREELGRVQSKDVVGYRVRGLGELASVRAQAQKHAR